MTRKLAWTGIPYCIALSCAVALRDKYDIILLMLAMGLAACAFILFEKHRVKIVAAAVFFCFGLLCCHLYTVNVYEKLVALDGKTVTIKGYVKDHSYTKNENTDRLVVCGRVGGIKTEIAFFVPADNYDHYDEIKVTGQVEKLTDSAKFNSESYNYTKGVFLQGKGTPKVTRSGRCTSPLLRSIRRFRDKMYDMIIENTDEREGAFLSAMLCGDKHEMDQYTKTSLYHSGLGHIFAVSGMHLIISAALFGFLVRKLIPIKYLDHLLILAEIWAFALFAGFSVTVVRAAVMASLSMSGFIFGRKSDCLNSLGLCAFLLTLTQPFAAASASFVLSFSAVFAIGCASELFTAKDEEIKNPVRRYFAGSLVPTLTVLAVTAPFMTLIFSGFSIATIVSNLVLLPLCVISLQLCFASVMLSFSPEIAQVLLKLASKPVTLVLKGSDLISSFMLSYVKINSAAGKVVVLLCSALMVYYCIKAGKRLVLYVCSGFSILVWTVLSVSPFLVDQVPKIAALPNGKKSVYVLTDNAAAYVFDPCSQGAMDTAVCSYLENTNARYIAAILIIKNGSITASGYNESLFMQPENIFIAPDPAYDEDRDVTVMQQEGTIRADDMRFTLSGDSYHLDIDGNEIILTGEFISINHDIINISNKHKLIEIPIEPQ